MVALDLERRSSKLPASDRLVELTLRVFVRGSADPVEYVVHNHRNVLWMKIFAMCIVSDISRGIDDK